MTFPQGPASMTPSTITQYISNMQSQLDEATRQTLYSAIISAGGLTIRQGGAFVIQTATGFSLLETRTRTFPDGTSYQPVVINRPPIGEPAFSIRPTQSTASAPFFWAMMDRSGNLIMTDDAVSGVGLATPWLAVPLYPMWTIYQTTNGQIEQTRQIVYSSTSNAGGSNQGSLNNPAWIGRIPYVSHPKFRVDGLWGWASGGSGTQITYTLNVGGLTTSWTAGTQAYYNAELDVTSLHGQSSVPVTLTVGATAYGNIVCHVFGAHMKGTG